MAFLRAELDLIAGLGAPDNLEGRCGSLYCMSRSLNIPTYLDFHVDEISSLIIAFFDHHSYPYHHWYPQTPVIPLPRPHFRHSDHLDLD